MLVSTVEFTFMQGALPLLSVDTSALTLAGGTATVPVVETVAGNKANIECSSRGTCGAFSDLVFKCLVSTNAAELWQTASRASARASRTS